MYKPQRLRKDLTGKRFGKLIAIRVVDRSRNKHIRWECQCDCGNKKSILSTHLISNKIVHCGCVRRPIGSDHKQWTGYGDISGALWRRIQVGASGNTGRRKMDITINIKHIWDLFLMQGGKCAISGVEINLNRASTGKYQGTASLDRIDSSLGYISGNVQWVHKDINKMKNSYDQSYFINMCRLVSNNNK